MKDIIVNDVEELIISIIRLCEDNDVGYNIKFENGENVYSIQIISLAINENITIESCSLDIIYTQLNLHFNKGVQNGV